MDNCFDSTGTAEVFEWCDSSKSGKNKKKEELELLKQSLFHLPGSNAPMVRNTNTKVKKDCTA